MATKYKTGKKLCRRCNTEYELDGFHLDRNRSDGHASQCKVCVREQAKTHWHAVGADRFRERTYGLTPDAYEAMVEVASGKCQICGRSDKRLVIDHCHETNAVRGLICDDCNVGLGRFRDDPNLLRTALNYLERNQS